MNLVEAYKKRIAVAESLYTKSHNGEAMSSNMKLVTAACLNNVSKFLNEAFTQDAATQADGSGTNNLGMYKKFALNLTNLALPNLIAPEIVMVHPMTSWSGYVTYMDYSTGIKKGETPAGKTLNGLFGFGDFNDGRVNYSGQAVVETFEADPTGKVAWTPVIEGSAVGYKSTGEVVEGLTVAADGTIGGTTTNVRKIAYKYDNVIIPQDKIPTVVGKMNGVSLQAKARRLAIHYSQFAAFQSKTDYGFDLAEDLARTATNELAYEIDSEIVELLRSAAGLTTTNLKFNAAPALGVSMSQQAEGFARVIELAAAKIYNKTGKFRPNYMLIGADIMPVITFLKGFVPSSVQAVAGPYLAGTYNGMKVFVSPMFTTNETDGTPFILGVNQDKISAAVYAPYMPVVPTALLQGPDGGTHQGFSTLYDVKLLGVNPDGTSPVLVGGYVYYKPGEQVVSTKTTA